MASLGETLARHRGIGPGFDVMRIVLAGSILAFHSAVAVGVGEQAETGPLWFVHFSLLPVFFALSGFLISGSALRLRLRDFLINRGIRIVPALAIEIFVSALVLGPLLTTVPLHEYFTSGKFFHYFTNILGLIQYELPGMFLHNPTAAIVNVSLWTVPYEIVCYALMSALIIGGLLRRPRLVLLLLGVFLIVPVLLSLLGFRPEAVPGFVGKPLSVLFMGKGAPLFASFLAGCLAYLYRDRIPVDRRLLLACLAVCVLLSVIGPGAWRTSGLLTLLACLPLTYVMAYLGMCQIGKMPLFSRGDYSYGIYLYGFPVQQTIVTAFPHLNVWVHFVLTVPFVSIVAMLSWHWIEKPVLHLRKNFSFMARKTEAVPEAAAAPAPLAGPMQAGSRA